MNHFKKQCFDTFKAEIRIWQNMSDNMTDDNRRERLITFSSQMSSDFCLNI